jgi:hypothetical protein
MCINIYAQEEEYLKKVSEKLQDYFLDSVYNKIKVELPNTENLIYSDWVKFHRKAIDTAQSIGAKQQLTKQFYRNYFEFPYEVDYYNHISNYKLLTSMYFDEHIYNWFRSIFKKPSGNLNYATPHYHRIVTMFNLVNHKNHILKHNGMYWVEHPGEYVQNRLQLILNEFKEKAKVSHFSISFLKDLVVLSNLEDEGYYKETIIKFFADVFSVIESKNSHKYSNFFMDVFIKDVLNVNTDIDLIKKTSYVLNHIMPTSVYDIDEWYSLSFAYFDEIILRNIDFDQPNKEFRKVMTTYLNEKGSVWADKLVEGEFTWTDKLIKIIKSDEIDWHFYMKGDTPVQNK